MALPSLRSTLRAAAALALACSALAAQAQTYISGSVSGQLAPGVYGTVDIGNAPPPALLYRQPIVIAPAPMAPPPVYMWVPPGHAKHWRQHCARYGACGRPVYFLRNPPPHWHAQPPRPDPRWREERRHREWEHRRDERRWDRDHRDDRRHDRDHGYGHDGGPRGHGHGRDHGRGHGRD